MFRFKREKCLILPVILAILLIGMMGCMSSGGTSGDLQPAPTTPEPPKDLPIEPILLTHTAALTHLQASLDSDPGISPQYNDCLDSSSNLHAAWLKAISLRTDGAWMLLALRMAEADVERIPEALKLIDQIRNHAHEVSIDDVLDFFEGKMLLRYSESQGEEDAAISLRQAREAFDRVQAMRNSPYFHEARAFKLIAAIRLHDVDESELLNFIATYPEYPGLLDFRIELATLMYERGETSRATQIVQEIAFYYPWAEASKRAEKWLQERQIPDKTWTFDEVFSRVDNLRKSRFWDDAEKAATQAMAQFPESYQLMVQHARIAYERSDHAEAAARFEKILEKLDGQTKDNLKPSGVIAYIYRAYAYMGDCEKALQYHQKNAQRLAKAARIRSTMEFALTCGALDVAYTNAKSIINEQSELEDISQMAFLAYLNHDYDTARKYYTIALESLSGTYKRRAQYFMAQATLKSAQQKTQQQANNQVAPTPQTSEKSTKSSKNTKSSKSSKSKKSAKKQKKSVTVPEATIELAQKQFKALLSNDSNDYYAILAWTRLHELESGNTNDSQTQTPVIQKFDGTAAQPSDILRPWTKEFTFDERELLADFKENVAKYRELFPDLDRVSFFNDAELYRERNQAFRTIAVEAIGIGRMKSRPTPKNLWTTKWSLDGHLVDNRKNDTGVWGIDLKEYRFSLPGTKDLTARTPIAERQAQIYAQASALNTFIKNTLVGFHDYYLARKYHTLPNKTCGSEDTLRACSIFYPHAYSEAVLNAVSQYNISPDIIWAVMNIESAFNPDSISHSTAYGLLQVIPMTGYKIAEAMQLQGFGPYDLIRPEASIPMGAWYFDQVLRKFYGYVTLSMAAYNGGPHQVARWLTAYGKKVEHDAFVELIPYNESRNYVKKGMARLLIFHRIDAGNPKLFFDIPNTLPESFEDMPNY